MHTFGLILACLASASHGWRVHPLAGWYRSPRVSERLRDVSMSTEDAAFGNTTRSGSSQSAENSVEKEEGAKPNVLLEDQGCNVALTHAFADFDTLAGAVALAKLWSVERPEHPTHVVMPHGANEAVARFLAYHKHLLPIRGISTIRAEDVRAIGVVDTQSASRLGPAAEWLEVAEHIAVYDHHEDSGHAPEQGGIQADEVCTENVGSATTVLVEQLRAKMEQQSSSNQSPILEISEEEATLFSLGIRADTGGLSYAGTTPRDVDALVFLMKHGASQAAVSEFGQHRLSASLRNHLTKAMGSVQCKVHESIKIGIVQLDMGSSYVTGMGAVAQQVLDLRSLDVLILAATSQTPKSAAISLIGRCSSRAPMVDLNEVMKLWKGGGHPAAAAASLHFNMKKMKAEAAEAAAIATSTSSSMRAEEKQFNVTEEAAAVLQESLQQVLSQIPKQVTAGELMTPAVSASSGDTMDAVLNLMKEVSAKALSILDEQHRPIGMLTYSDALRAVQEGKGSDFVTAWIQRPVVTIQQDTSLADIEDVFLKQENTGRLPVVDSNSTFLGVVSRTDVLRQRNMYISLVY